MLAYLTVFMGSVLLAIILTPMVIFVARSLNIYDDLNVRKIHASAIPRIGGLAIVLSTLGATVPIFWLRRSMGGGFDGVGRELLVLLAGGVFIFLVGL